MNNKKTEKLPLVSIGVPVFNEETYICETLDSLLAQNYENIEIIISDNCSTDATATICKKYAAENSHLIYTKTSENRGPGDNFNQVLFKATGEYFMWASGHDLWQENYVKSCVETFLQYESAVLVFTKSEWIDEQNKQFQEAFGGSDTRGLTTIARYITVFWGHMNMFLGLIKRDILIQEKFINTVGADLIILSALALEGDFVFAENTKWSRREFRREKNYAQRLERYRSEEYGLSRSIFSKVFPLFRLPLELIRIVLKAKLGLAEKSLLLMLLFVLFPFRYIVGKFFR